MSKDEMMEIRVGDAEGIERREDPVAHRAREALSALERHISQASLAERGALAFIVEAVRRSAPEGWEQELARLADELRAVHEADGETGVRWRLAGALYEQYSHFLDSALGRELDPKRRARLGKLKEMISSMWSTRQDAYRKGKPTPIGAVIKSHLPSWFTAASS